MKHRTHILLQYIKIHSLEIFPNKEENDLFSKVQLSTSVEEVRGRMRWRMGEITAPILISLEFQMRRKDDDT